VKRGLRRISQISQISITNLSLKVLKTILPKAILTVGQKTWDQGVKSKNYNHFARALTIFETIINDFSGSDVIADAYYFAGECYGVLGQREKKIQYFQAVVDSWPDYKATFHCQNIIGSYYEILVRNGQMSASQADPVIKQAYENLVQSYPGCPPAQRAIMWLNSYNERVKGGQQ
jgi:hypothetical protein